LKPLKEQHVMREFTNRWGSWVDPKPIQPGVFRRQGGGFLVRKRVIDPRTGRRREFKKVLPEADLATACKTLWDGVAEIRSGIPTPAKAKIHFINFAVSLFEEKTLPGGKIKSAKGREKWEHVIRLHLAPTFGDHLMAEPITRDLIVNWLKASRTKVKESGEPFAPTTINGWLDVLRVIINEAAVRFRWTYNPMDELDPLDTSDSCTYPEEEPNSLTPQELVAFLKVFLHLFPQHYAFAVLGFALGLRPSSLRPLRWKGPTPDVRWDESILLIRQSHTCRQEVMAMTKQKTRYRLKLPPGLMTVLRWHVENLPEGPMRESDLLFPATTGRLAAASTLQKPFAKAAVKAGIKKKITPHAMRRTFQDLARAADVKDIITRRISGHATETMQIHYSTIEQTEICEALSKVTKMVGFDQLLEGAPRGGAEVVRNPANDHSHQGGSTENP
jgi:integrase